ncbi:MAG: hypothetical protein AAF497_29035 [Planctomycetota bacterium]
MTTDLNSMLANGPIHDGIEVTPLTESFDLNGDGILDPLDTDRWLADAAQFNGLEGPYLYGDANLDGDVDVSDFNLWNSNKFTPQVRWDRGDFNGDGQVDVSDFNAWNQNKFRRVLPANSLVPEPSCWLLTLFALANLILVVRKRR